MDWENRENSRIEGIDLEEALRYSVDGVAGVWENIGNYLEEAPEYREQLNTFFSQGEYNEYRVLAHGLKSTLALIGGKAMSEQAKAMEQAGKVQDYDYIRLHHAEFDQNLKEWNQLLLEQYRKIQRETLE